MNMKKSINTAFILLNLITSRSFSQNKTTAQVEESIKEYYKNLKIGYDQKQDNGYYKWITFSDLYEININQSNVTLSYNYNKNYGHSASTFKTVLLFDLKQIDSIAFGGIQEYRLPNDTLQVVPVSSTIKFFAKKNHPIKTIYFKEDDAKKELDNEQEYIDIAWTNTNNPEKDFDKLEIVKLFRQLLYEYQPLLKKNFDPNKIETIEEDTSLNINYLKFNNTINSKHLITPKKALDSIFNKYHFGPWANNDLEHKIDGFIEKNQTNVDAKLLSILLSIQEKQFPFYNKTLFNSSYIPPKYLWTIADLEAIADQNNAYANLFLGYLYTQDKPLHQNLITAQKYLEKALQLGLPYSKTVLESIKNIKN